MSSPSKVDLRDLLSRTVHNLDDSIIRSLQVSKKTSRGFVGFYGFTCPGCGESSYENRSFKEAISILRSNNGFVCGFCLNGDKKLTEDPSMAGVLLKSKFSVIRILTKLSKHLKRPKELEGKQQWKKELKQDWFKFLTLKEEGEKRTILLTVSLESGTFTKSLANWNIEILSSIRMNSGNFATVNGYVKQESKHIERLRAAHPNGVGVQLNSAREISDFNCGEVTVIGSHVFEHDDFHISTNKLSERIKKNGDKTSFCLMCCEEEHSLIPPKTEKTIEMINRIWQVRGAKISLFLGIDDISRASVKLLEGDKVVTSSKLQFTCINPEHEPSDGTYSNKMGKGKGGYCKKCLKAAGLSTLEDIKLDY